jgi:hypothetical protein
MLSLLFIINYYSLIPSQTSLVLIPAPLWPALGPFFAESSRRLRLTLCLSSQVLLGNYALVHEEEDPYDCPLNLPPLKAFRISESVRCLSSVISCIDQALRRWVLFHRRHVRPVEEGDSARS